MARKEIDDDAEDALFRIFDHSQGLQRRVFRIIARRFFNEAGIDEMRRQARGLLDDIETLAEMITPDEKGV